MARRRRFSADFKARVVLELITGAKNQSQVCREYELNPNMVSRWEAEFVGGGKKASALFNGNLSRSERW